MFSPTARSLTHWKDDLLGRKHRQLEFAPAPGPEVCPLCCRPIPAAQRDLHHLVPRVKGGKQTQAMHRICHRQIHALFSEAELAQRYASADALLEHPDVQRFVAWVDTKPADFYDSPKRANRRR